MKKAQKNLNTDTLVPVIEVRGKNIYNFAWRHGLYKHPITNVNYLRHDRWEEEDSLGGYRFFSHWFRVTTEEADRVYGILDNWYKDDTSNMLLLSFVLGG